MSRCGLQDEIHVVTGEGTIGGQRHLRGQDVAVVGLAGGERLGPVVVRGRRGVEELTGEVDLRRQAAEVVGGHLGPDGAVELVAGVAE